MTQPTVEIKFLGQKIVLKTSADSTQAKHVADLVSDRLASAESRFKGQGAAHLVALLALFELAEEYLAAKERVQEHQELLRTKIEGLAT